ncbi:glycosyltransferase family 4 protein [Rheinheimera muenzenbergensis]|uniref:Glycosyltransferase family 4 protein n=1 Tax=Rheinheimera muenzenbergensis TaxID=1193628 RepID=A0ABU8C9J7_9GAMM
MQTIKPNILIISNMGAKPSAPFQGKFVHNQVWALAPLNPAYHYMRWHSDSLLNKFLKYPVFLLDFIWRFLLSRRRFDIVHVHYFYPTIYLALLYRALRNRRLKIVVTCHGSDIYLYQRPAKLYRYCATKVDQWIFASSALRKQFSLPVKRAVVLSAGIAELYGQSEPLSWQQKSIDLLYVGSLDVNKGMDRLLTILPELADKKVVIAGSGPMLSALQHAARQFPNVLVVGPKDSNALKQLYRQARCFISLSRHEAFGLVMAEAMASYTPVIATATDGAAEQLQHDVNGYVVSQHNDEQQICSGLLNAINELFQSPQQYHAMQLAAWRSAQPYLLSNIARQLQQLYQELADE